MTDRVQKPQALLPLCLDVDGSLPRQEQVVRALHEVADLRTSEDALRLWATSQGLTAVREVLCRWQVQYPQPWLTFLGSGDCHHLTLLLLDALCELARPVTLVVIDNHPDWFAVPPRYHCGNWVSGALRLPWLRAAILIGQDSPDLEGPCFWRAPFRELRSGRVSLFPYGRSRIGVPLRWPRTVAGAAASARRWYGVELSFQTIQQCGARHLFDELAVRVAGQRVYLSVDKDCLAAPFAATDWEQGRLSLDELRYGIQRLREAATIVGADVCGDAAQKPLRGFWKRFDAARLIAGAGLSADQRRINEETNLSLLDAFAPLYEVSRA